VSEAVAAAISGLSGVVAGQLLGALRDLRRDRSRQIAAALSRLEAKVDDLSGRLSTLEGLVSAWARMPVGRH
jgi:hypothetical protein